jgi:hypothetical protein
MYITILCPMSKYKYCVSIRKRKEKKKKAKKRTSKDIAELAGIKSKIKSETL